MFLISNQFMFCDNKAPLSLYSIPDIGFVPTQKPVGFVFEVDKNSENAISLD